MAVYITNLNYLQYQINHFTAWTKSDSITDSRLCQDEINLLSNLCCLVYPSLTGYVQDGTLHQQSVILVLMPCWYNAIRPNTVITHCFVVSHDRHSDSHYSVSLSRLYTVLQCHYSLHYIVVIHTSSMRTIINFSNFKLLVLTD